MLCVTYHKLFRGYLAQVVFVRKEHKPVCLFILSLITLRYIEYDIVSIIGAVLIIQLGLYYSVISLPLNHGSGAYDLRGGGTSYYYGITVYSIIYIYGYVGPKGRENY